MNNLINYNKQDNCYLKGSKILCIRNREEVYINIEHIDIGEIIVTFGDIINDLHLIYKKSKSIVMWIGTYSYSGMNNLDLPICIKKGSLSNSKSDEIIPSEDVRISQRHRICVDSIFTCASNLLEGNKIYIDENIEKIKYYHLKTLNHKIINVSGIMSETMYDDIY